MNQQLLPSLLPSGGRDRHTVAATAQRFASQSPRHPRGKATNRHGALSSGYPATVDWLSDERKPAHYLGLPQAQSADGTGAIDVTATTNPMPLCSVMFGVAAGATAATSLHSGVPSGPSSPRWDGTPPAPTVQARGVCHADGAGSLPTTLPPRRHPCPSLRSLSPATRQDTHGVRHLSPTALRRSVSCRVALVTRSDHRAVTGTANAFGTHLGNGGELMPTDAREADETIRIAERMEERTRQLVAFVRQSITSDGVIPEHAARQILRDAAQNAALARNVVESAEDTSIKELIAASVLTRHGPSPHLVARAAERGIVIVPLEIHRRSRRRPAHVDDGDGVPLDAA